MSSVTSGAGRIGNYQLVARIASGGMAEIHVARGVAADAAPVAVVKRLLPEHLVDPDYVEMFVDEGRITAALDHPNVVRMFQAGFEAGVPFLAMEYLHGVDLRTLMRTAHQHGAPLPLPLALLIVRGICAGLHHAHEATTTEGQPMEVVHRDVSPQNVLVTFDGAVKIVDFGIAKSRVRVHQTRAGALKGKVPYMAPEQIRGSALDRRTDVYAAGVILYELAVGRRPYVVRGEDAEPQGEFSLMMAIVGHEVVPPTAVSVEVPAALDDVVMTALAARPESRYRSMRDMQLAIEQLARDQGLAADARALAGYMVELFGDQGARWNTAVAGHGDLAHEVASLARARAAVDDSLDPTTIQPRELGETTLTSPIAELAGTTRDMSQPVIYAHGNAPLEEGTANRDGITVITPEPRLNETFRGGALGHSLRGMVVMDLSAIERISSYGVREWMEMNSAIVERGDVARVYLARCSEAVVTQLAMIRGFAGPARVVSFQVPFLCRSCGHDFPHVLDSERDAAQILRGRITDVPCPRCGGASQFDDHVNYFAGIIPHLGQPIPPLVRVMLDRLEGAAHTDGPIDKIIEGNVTRLRVLRPIEPSFRWSRVLDGLEGRVVLDLLAAGQLGPDVHAGILAALRGLGPEVPAVDIAGCPVAMSTLLPSTGSPGGGTSGPPLTVVSVAVEGKCPACNARRTVTMSRRQLDRLRDGSHVPVCRRCDADLIEIDLSGLDPAVPEPATAAAATPAPTPTPTPVPTGPAAAPAARAPAALDANRLAMAPTELAAVIVDPAAAGPSDPAPGLTPRPAAPRRRLWPVVLGLGAVGALGVVVAIVTRDAPRPATPGPAPAARVVWSERDRWMAVGVGQGATSEAALGAARAQAVARLVGQLEVDLPARFAQAGGGATTSDRAIADVFDRQVGAFAAPDRHDVRSRRTDAGYEVTVTLALAAASYDRALAYYGTAHAVFGCDLVSAHPSRGLGAVVVGAGAGCPLLVGDRVLAAAQEAVIGAAALTELASRRPLTLDVERGGLTQQVEVEP
jgi:hypothetical protein